MIALGMQNKSNINHVYFAEETGQFYVNFNAIKIASSGYERKSHISLGSIFITLPPYTMPYGLLEN